MRLRTEGDIEIDAKDPDVAVRSSFNCRSACSGGMGQIGSKPNPPALLTAAASLGPAMPPPIGACTMGKLRSRSSVSLLCSFIG